MGANQRDEEGVVKYQERFLKAYREAREGHRGLLK